MRLQYILNDLKFGDIDKSIFNAFIVFIILLGIAWIIGYISVKIKFIFRSGVMSRGIKTT